MIKFAALQILVSHASFNDFGTLMMSMRMVSNLNIVSEMILKTAVKTGAKGTMEDQLSCTFNWETRKRRPEITNCLSPNPEFRFSSLSSFYWEPRLWTNGCCSDLTLLRGSVASVNAGCDEATLKTL